MPYEPLVMIVDGDAELRRSLSGMLEAAGLRSLEFESAEALLENFPPDRLEPRCLVLDARLPGLSGLDLLRILLERGKRFPFLILTAQADVPMAVTAMKWGATDFLEKPLHRTLLLDRIREALDQDMRRILEIVRRQKAEERLATLTPREHEVLDLLIQGKNNKRISQELQIGIQTAAKHASRVLEKTGVENAVELARLMQEMRPGLSMVAAETGNPRKTWVIAAH